MTTITEADVEAAALGWAVANDPAIARTHPTPSVPRAHREQRIGVVQQTKSIHEGDLP